MKTSIKKRKRALQFLAQFTDGVRLITIMAWLMAGQGAVSAAAAKSKSLANWIRNPITLPVTITGTNMYGDPSSTVTVTINDVGLTQSGSVVQTIGSATPTNTTPFIFGFKPRKEYIVTVEATALSSMEITFAYQPNWTPLSATGRESKPKEYRLYKDRELMADNKITVPAGTNTWIVELTEQLPAQWRLEDGSDNPSFAPGDGVWAQLGPGKSLQTNQTAFSWSVGLGRLMDGLAAGRLTVRETGISRASYTPAVLYYTAGSAVLRDEIELVPVSIANPVLRQIKAYQAFVDIVTPSTNETEMRFYLASQVGTETNSSGYYTNMAGNPFVVWALVNPDPSGTNKLNIIERRNGINNTNEIVFAPNSADSTWTLRYGKGPEQRVETRTINFNYSPTTNRIEIADVRYSGATTPAHRAQETYRLFPWGFELVETRVDPDNDNLMTTFTFNTDAGNEFAYKRLNSIVNPDGSWEKRVYNFDDLYDFAVLRPFGESPETPEEADEDNSTVRLYDPGLAGFTFAPPYSEEKILRWEYSFDWTSGWIEHRPQGEFTTFMAGWSDPGAFLGNNQRRGGEQMGFGYYDHPITEVDSTQPSTISYYNAVSYNSTNFTYAVNLENAIWEGPDWRSCNIYTVHDSALSYGFPDENGDFLSARWADGEQLFDPIDFDFQNPYFVINQSWRDSQVFHRGSLALREQSVFTGVTDDEAEFDLVCKWVYQNDSLGHATNVIWVDGVTAVSRVIYSADYRGTNAVDGDLKLSETDEYGVKTVFTYDSLKRLKSQRKEGVTVSGDFPAQSAVTNIFGYDAYGRTLEATNSAGTLTLSSHQTFDISGRVTAQTEPNGLTTTFAYELGGRRTVKTFPNGATEIRENQIDGRLKSVTGTGVVNEFHNWEFVGENEDPYLFFLGMMDSVRLGSDDSSRLTWRAYDWPGRQLLLRRPNYQSANFINEWQHYFSERPGLLLSTFRTTGYLEGAEQMAIQMSYHDLVDTATNASLSYRRRSREMTRVCS